MKRLLPELVVGACVLAASSGAHAQSADQKASAEALFNDAMARMKQGDYATACPKLEQSLAIDFAVGALARLAECHEKIGKTASAWAKYKEVASRAQQLGQSDRQRLAEHRASALEPQLSRLLVDASKVNGIAGLEVTRNGEALPALLLGSDFPVDPGEHTLVVRAPGYETTTVRVSVPPGASTTTATLPAPVPAPGTSAPADDERKTPPGPLEPSDDAQGGGSTRAVIGYVAAGLGLVGLGVGGVFYWKRTSSLSARDKACPAVPNGDCSSESARLAYESHQMDARGAARISTISVIAGAALAVGGGVIILTAPSAASTETSVRFVPVVTPRGAGLFTEVRL